MLLYSDVRNRRPRDSKSSALSTALPRLPTLECCKIHKVTTHIATAIYSHIHVSLYKNMKYAQVPGYEGAPLYASDQLALAFLNPVLFHL